MGWQGDCSIKYRPRLKLWKNSTGTVRYEPELEEAYSYGWCFLKRIKGKLVFNDYNYSVTTSGHQCTVRALLRKLNIKVDLTIKSCGGLSRESLSDALEDCYVEIFEARIELNRKGVRDLDCRKQRIEIAEGKIPGLRSLGAKCSRKRQSELRHAVLGSENKRIERMETDRLERAKLRVFTEGILDTSWKS